MLFQTVAVFVALASYVLCQDSHSITLEGVDKKPFETGPHCVWFVDGKDDDKGKKIAAGVTGTIGEANEYYVRCDKV